MQGMSSVRDSMQCQGLTKSGQQCRNQATSNGFCHIHGGLPSRNVARRESQRAYVNMTPEQKAEHDHFAMGCMFMVIVLALIFGLLTGDWHGVGKWLSR